MTTTDTPRTDAAIELYGDRPFMVEAVPVEFAEELERELSEADERAEKAEAERDAYKKLALELCAELCQICKDPIHLKQLEELSK